MTMLRAGLLNFSKGVLSEKLHGRVDVAAYNAGLKRGENVVVLKQGALTIRPGFEVINEAADPLEWLMPFQFSDEQVYALTFGQGYMQPLTGGGVVLETELVVVNISQANPAVVTAENHGYAAGDQVFLATILGPLGAIVNNRIWTVGGALDADRFTINLNTLTLPAFTGSTGGTTRVDPPPAPPPVPATPPVYVPPDPPPVYGGGGYCVTADTPILLWDGTEVPARELAPGSLLSTQAEGSMQWGHYPVSAIEFAPEPVLVATIGGRRIRATADHRFWIDGAWVRMETIGEPDGEAVVAKITVDEAHTYVSAGVLSHNIKSTPREENYQWA